MKFFSWLHEPFVAPARQKVSSSVVGYRLYVILTKEHGIGPSAHRPEVDVIGRQPEGVPLLPD